MESHRVAFADKTMTCRDCGQSFLFTSGEQDFFAQKGFTNEPSRCPACRGARRAERGDGGSSGGGYGGQREMFEATCSSCGGVARVPFQPSGEKPVYCSNCFQSQRSSGGGSYGGGGNSYGGGGGGRSGGRSNNRW
jgi:CxxC-x17-CxxC domain-containing protein